MQSSQNELVSIIIPFYNEKNYFEECIESVLNQTYLNYEIIIINDGSDKIFEEKLENLQSKNPEKIKVFNKKNEGVSLARNLGIQKSEGEYIAFLDADDSWLPDKLQHQINIIKKKKIEFIHGSYFVVDESEKFAGKFIAKNLNYEKLIKSCDIGLSTVLIKSDLIKRHVFEKISTKEDYVCWLSIIKEIKVLYGDEKVVTKYRNRKGSLSSNILIKFSNAFKVYNIYENKNLIYSIYYTLGLSIYWIFKTFKIIYVNPDKIQFKYILETREISFENSFILSALNMASLSNMNLFYLNNKETIFWLDGYCAKYLIKNYKKKPGRMIINEFELPQFIKKIYLCGNESLAQINYLEKKFNKKINFVKVPFFKKLEDIKNYKIDIDDISLVVINISTPKQEVLANQILKNNIGKKIFILCLGGGVSMVCGEEKVVPERIEKMNLEWLWRLRTNTFFRLKRLLSTSFIFFLKLITNFYKKFEFKNFN